MRVLSPHWPRLALLAALLGCAFLGLVAEAPNRLLSGHPIPIWDAVSGGTVAWTMILAVLLGVTVPFGASRAAHGVAVALSGLLLVLLCAAAGEAARAFAAHAAPAARTMLGAGFWGGCMVLSLACVDALQAVRAGPGLRGAVGAVAVAAIGGLAAAGRFDALSLAREYAAHRAAFADALIRHVALVGLTLVLALAIGVPLGLAAQGWPRWRRPVFSTLNILQTIPSVAVFGLLMAPLAGAGFSGIGLAPALLALVMYGLLPVVRGVVTGLDGVSEAAIEAATGLGLTRVQRLLRVELPLALPAFWAGLRLVTVQTVGLAVVAALIGAGGFGDFVFQGLGQYAIDLVLLGALPTIALALLADFLLGVAARPPAWRGG